MIQAIDEPNAASETNPLSTVAHAPTATGDRAVLSEAAARATLLSQEGLTVPEIADELGVTYNVVMTELGISDIAA